MNKPPTGKRKIIQEFSILDCVTHVKDARKKALADPINMEIRIQISDHLEIFTHKSLAFLVFGRDMIKTFFTNISIKEENIAFYHKILSFLEVKRI